MAQDPAVSAWTVTVPDEAVRAVNGNGSRSSAGAFAQSPSNHQRPLLPKDDPFYSASPSTKNLSRRFSHFDSQRFDLSPSTSPAQAKRALEAHLVETDKRIQDASKLGTNLVQQRRNLTQRLKEVEQQQADREIGPELRQKLIDFEAEYNEVAKESARAFLGPKSKVPQADEGTRGADGQQADGPAIYSSQATASPSKISVPSRKTRNQPSGRAQDIEFATDIGASLLSQVRNLQIALAEKEEMVRTFNLDKSQLEAEVDGLKQRLRNLDESEQRYKDENWNLETQIHELMAAAKEAADREQKSSQALNATAAEKNSVLRELDEIKQANGKLVEDHSASLKHHDMELSSLRRELSSWEADRNTLQRKTQELTAQNQELARAIAGRAAYENINVSEQSVENDGNLSPGVTTPEHSPPPSPTKGTPRHNMLESETLKSSLHHAHRMIQNLKGNIHREKTEKVELKRMLQEARDELELRRNEGTGALASSSAGKRRKAGSDKDVFKKPLRPNLLGIGRNGKSEVFMDETGWEDHLRENSPASQRAAPQSKGPRPGRIGSKRESAADPVGSAEGSDAFETANEQDDATTENEAFLTGAESLFGESSDTETETEDAIKRGGTIRGKPSPSPMMARAGQRDSYVSTASVSGDEEQYRDYKTPVPAQQRYRIKINRAAAYRRSKSSGETGILDSESNSVKDSPASFVSNSGPSASDGQTLFAELDELDAEFDEDSQSISSTPNRPGLASRTSTSGSMRGLLRRNPALFSGVPLSFKPEMADVGTMTEPEASPSLAPHLADATAVSEDQHSSKATGGEAMYIVNEPEESAASILDSEAGPMIPEIEVGKLEPTGERTPGVVHEQSFISDEQRSGPLVQSEPNKMMSQGLSTAALAISPVLVAQIQPAEFSVSKTDQTELLSHSNGSRGTKAISDSDAAVLPPVPILPEVLTFSPIITQEIIPVAATLSTQSQDRHLEETSSPIAPLTLGGVQPERVRTELADPRSSKSGLYSSMLAWANPPTNSVPLNPTEDENAQIGKELDLRPTPGAKSPFRVISNNIGQRPVEKGYTDTISIVQKVEMTDQSSQTVLSSDQMEDVFYDKDPGVPVPTGEHDLRPTPSSPSKRGSGQSQSGRYILRTQETYPNTGRTRAKVLEQELGLDEPSPSKLVKRPNSSGSIRSSYSTHPPLPPDHKQAIAAAAQKATAEPPGGLMGPPITPASAYRTHNQPLKVRTSGTQIHSSPGSKAGTTPRARHSAPRSDVSSAITRRSSVSSFASELDERFNIRTDNMPMPYGFEGPGTDPQMIQAITQTMIGEYLWKYTRKAGRGEMSGNRHRRFFWVHPYTRTLYWSDRNPASGGRAELKAKSVAIEAVRVITDDNPMPPGLHRKSLVVVTPGRTIKFTAATNQRHNTWFNALSYLLLRTGAESGAQRNEDLEPNQHLTAEDVNEFNPSYGQHRPGPSMSSYNTRPTGTMSPARSTSRAPSRSRTAALPDPATSTASSNVSQAKPARHQGSISRLSQMFRPASGFAASLSGRRSRVSAKAPSIHNGSVAHDSAEDLREVMARQEREADRLENVRACCEGKHDVRSLAKRGSRASRHSLVHGHEHEHAQ